MIGPGRQAPVWRRSTHCGASLTCVEVAAWRRAAASSCEGNCVEAGRILGGADAGGVVAVRDSKDPDGPMLVLTRAGWWGLLTAVKGSGHG